MGTVYSCALATLIPLTGTDASTTLSTRRRRSNEAFVQGPKAIEFEQEIKRSTYAQRGWTFQERILSARCIFFGAKEGYFACHTSFIQDGAETRESPDYLPTRLRPLNPFLLGVASELTICGGLLDQQFEIYMNIVQSYTAKSLPILEIYFSHSMASVRFSKADFNGRCTLVFLKTSFSSHFFGQQTLKDDTIPFTIIVTRHSTEF